MGIHDSTMRAAVADFVPAHRRGGGYGTFTAIYGLAWLAGASIIGLLYEHGPHLAVIFIAAGAAVRHGIAHPAAARRSQRRPSVTTPAQPEPAQAAPKRRRGVRAFVPAGSLLVAAAVFTVLVVVRFGPMHLLDRDVALTLNHYISHRRLQLAVWKTITTIGGPSTWRALGALAAILLWYRRRDVTRCSSRQPSRAARLFPARSRS